MTEPRVFTPPLGVLRNMTERASVGARHKQCSGQLGACTENARHACSSIGGQWCDTCWPIVRELRGAITPNVDPTRTAEALRQRMEAAGDQNRSTP